MLLMTNNSCDPDTLLKMTPFPASCSGGSSMVQLGSSLPPPPPIIRNSSLSCIHLCDIQQFYNLDIISFVTNLSLSL